MLTGIKTKKLTYHHTIEKHADGGNNSIKNGSLLISDIHEWLHKIEIRDVELYWLICECLDLYKKCRDKQLQDLTKQFEEEVQPEVVKRIKKKVN